LWKEKKVKIVIIGGGKVGSKLSEELSNESHDVTVIEQDVDVINRINSHQDVACINGNAINREILKEAGVAAVVAKSFARIFYRNSFNTGLLILEIKETDEINEGDTLKIDVDNGVIVNESTKKEYKFNAIPPFMQELLNAGGLIEYAKAKMN